MIPHIYRNEKDREECLIVENMVDHQESECRHDLRKRRVQSRGSILNMIGNHKRRGSERLWRQVRIPSGGHSLNLDGHALLNLTVV